MPASQLERRWKKLGEIWTVGPCGESLTQCDKSVASLSIDL